MDHTFSDNLKINRKRIAITTFLSFVIGWMSNSLLSILLLPLVSKIIGENTYGLWMIMIELSSLGPIMRVINQLFNKRLTFYHNNKDIENLNIVYSLYLSTIFFTSIVIFLVVSLINIILLINPFLKKYFYTNYTYIIDFVICSEIIFITAILQIVANAFYNISINFQKPNYFHKVTIVFRLLIQPTIYLFALANQNLYGLAYGYLIITLIYTFFFFLGIKKDFNFRQLHYRYNHNLFKKEFSSYIYAIFSTLLGIVSNSSGWILGFLFNPTIVFEFKINQKLYETVSNTLSLYMDSVGPALNHYKPNVSLQTFKYKILKILILFTVLALLGSLTTFLINPFFISIWINKNIFLGDNINSLLALQTLCGLLSNGINNLNRYIGNYNQSSKLYINENLILLSLSFVLINFWHIPGLIIASILVSITFIILYFNALKKCLS